MADIFKVAVFDTVEAANEFRTKNVGALQVPNEAPVELSGKFCVKVYGGPQVQKQTLGVIRNGTLIISA